MLYSIEKFYNMNSRQIDCFLELARTLNYSQAARFLGISQPSLSYQIDSLESEVGFRLFDRSGRGTSLTPAGESMLESLRKIRLETRDAVERAQNISKGYRESIELIVPLRSCIRFLPSILRRFDTEVPNVLLNVTVEYRDDLVERIRDGTYDMAFVMRREVEHLKDLRFEHLFDSGMFVLVGIGDPLASKVSVSPEDLEGRRVLVGGGSFPELVSLQHLVMEAANVVVKNVSSSDAAYLEVESGRGVVIAPGFTNDVRPQFRWIPIKGAEKLECGLAVRSDESRVSVVRFIEMSRQVYSFSDDPLL